MCGIFGYIGKNHARDYILESLKRLEYRGYDSSGYALLDDNEIEVIKDNVRVSELGNIKCEKLKAKIGIGHTRWATHGAPSNLNAHPHMSFDGRIAIVHNGIIENYKELKSEILKHGIKLKSETDSEIIAQLITLNYEDDLSNAIEKTVEKLQGAFSMLVMAYDKQEIFAYRKNVSLIIGLGNNENFVASDMIALMPYTDKVIILEDDDLVCLTDTDYKITRFTRPKVGKITKIDQKFIEDKPISTYMQKEIEEIPFSVERTIKGMLSPEGVDILDKDIIKKIDAVYITGCGTAYNAGLYGKFIIEKLANIPTDVVIASETRENTLFFSPKKLVVCISQSGETIDTISALKIASAMGSPTVAVTNTRGSSITNLADYSLYLDAGPEIAVAATKTYNSQLVAMYIFAVKLAVMRGTMTAEYGQFLLEDLDNLCRDLRKTVCDNSICRYARCIARDYNYFFIGRGADFISAKEGALKFKEITYKMTGAYPSGELKHGTIALIDESSLVISVLTNRYYLNKINTACSELKTRGAKILMISSLADAKGDKTIFVDANCNDMLMPIVAIVPLQKLAMTVASELGHDVDKPRNLAKCVTVE